MATVGRFSISDRDVSYRNAVTKIYFPEEKRDLGRDLLIKSFTFAQILENNDHPISPDVLTKEAKRISDTTLKPEMLQSIKDVFGADQEGYLKNFVLPTYAERVLYYEFFLHSPKVQEPSHQVAAEYLKETLAKPDRFGRTPPEMPAKNKFVVSLTNGIVWDQEKSAAATMQEVAKNQHRSQEALKWKAEVVDTLKSGQVFPKVMDLGDTWLVVRYLGPQKKDGVEDYQFEGVLFPKANFDEWLKQEKEKVKVQIN